jgi:hypothetical protein
LVHPSSSLSSLLFREDFACERNETFMIEIIKDYVSAVMLCIVTMVTMLMWSTLSIFSRI